MGFSTKEAFLGFALGLSKLCWLSNYARLGCEAGTKSCSCWFLQEWALPLTDRAVERAGAAEEVAADPV